MADLTPEVRALLEGANYAHLATLMPDGSPHSVAVWTGIEDDHVVFFTQPQSQKARNLARDPRVTCLVETGEEYFELRGVQVVGTARCVEDPAGVLEIGRGVAAVTTGMTADALAEYTAHTARKRVGFVVEPLRVISWDHRRLARPG